MILRPPRHLLSGLLLAVFAACPLQAASSGSAGDSDVVTDVATDVLPPAMEDFPAWLLQFRREAAAQGISAEVLDAALGGIEPLPQVLELDRRQPEFVDTFRNYLDRRVSEARIAAGRALLNAHQELLQRLAVRYGIPPNLLVALWGLETNYGGYLGGHPIPAALATLAHEPRRSEFFRGQLLDALRILQAGHIAPGEMRGSWAGAMGQMQFMPSTFLAYAVDWDGDGRKDVWHSLPDAFASAANYLQQLGWREDERWGLEVRLPEDFDWRQAQLGVRRTVNAWAALGVRNADGDPLPRGRLQGAILLPQGHAGPAFLVFSNYHAILDWNRSIHYALAVGLLADRLAGLPPLRNGLDADNRVLTLQDAMDLQRRLAALGFDPGAPDGILGSRTRVAIRAFQMAHGLPADGHPSHGLLERLQAVVATDAGGAQLSGRGAQRGAEPDLQHRPAETADGA